MLPTLGGQTALNAAIALHDAGILEKHGVELIGADVDAIQRGEDRQTFKEIVQRGGGSVPRSAAPTGRCPVAAAAPGTPYASPPTSAGAGARATGVASGTRPVTVVATNCAP